MAIRRNSPALAIHPSSRAPDIHRSSPADIRSNSHPSRAIHHRAATARSGRTAPLPADILLRRQILGRKDRGQPPPGTQGAPAKKSPVMIIAIVAAAIVLLAAVGGIIMVLNRGGTDQPDVSITPSQPAPPTEEPTPQPSGRPSSQPQPTPTESSQSPTGGAIDLGNGVELVPATGWEVKKTGKNVAQLSNGKSVFLGQSLQISPSTNPGQLCDAWHRDVAEGTSNGKFQDAKDADVGTTRLKAATCVAEVTVSGGQGTTKLYLFSLVSVRQSDGVTVIGTAYFTPNTETDQLNKDFTSMINSMLKSQASGG